MTDLRIIIATLNSEFLLERCLNSIIKNTLRTSFEIVVIDNASIDNTLEMLQKSFPSVRVICNKKNIGIAPSRNQGIRNNKSRYVLFLDADTKIENRAIDKMVEFMDENPQVGICGSKLVSPNGDLQLTCRNYHNLLTPFLRRATFLKIVRNSKLLNNFLMKNWDHATPNKVDHVIGACQLIRKEVISRIGLLDKRMFYGWEDTDYCVRNMYAGFETWYFPYSTIIHYEQRRTWGKFFNRLFFEHMKSMILFFRKYPSGILGRY